METITNIFMIITITALVSFVITGTLVELSQQSYAELAIPDDMKTRDFINWAIRTPTFALAGLSGVKKLTESTEAQKAIFLAGGSIVAMVCLFISQFYYGWNWAELGLGLVMILFLYIIASRVHAVSTIWKARGEIKTRNTINDELLCLDEEHKEVSTVMKRHEDKLNKAIRIVTEKEKELGWMEQIISDTKKSIIRHIKKEETNVDKIQCSLDALREWKEEGALIALDTNILMECEDYIIEELKNYPLLISKKVQDEWDGNKKSTSDITREKAIRARNRLANLQENARSLEFTVKKWNSQFMKDNNLMIGKNDEEIIADYLYEYKRGQNLVILSCDKMFQISASTHMPVIKMEQ